MNAGLSSLTKLKEQLLAEALRADTAYDAVLLAIGKGVSGQMQKHCNRLFQRVANETYIVSADREFVYLPRAPIESVASIAIKTDQATGYEVQTNFIINQDDSTGYLYWGADAGPHYGRVKIIYTGGWWWDETEEGNDTIPATATALPDDLLLAWQLQCRLVWQAIDKLGVDITKTGSSSQFVTGTLAGIKINEQTLEILRGYIRYAMS